MSHAEKIIPEHVQAFAREFTALASKHGLREASIRLSFGYRVDRAWDEPITIVWEEGRHGEDARKFHISTTLHIRGDLRQEPQP
jgi:hypothetical protein